MFEHFVKPRSDGNSSDNVLYSSYCRKIFKNLFNYLQEFLSTITVESFFRVDRTVVERTHSEDNNEVKLQSTRNENSNDTNDKNNNSGSDVTNVDDNNDNLKKDTTEEQQNPSSSLQNIDAEKQNNVKNDPINNNNIPDTATTPTTNPTTANPTSTYFQHVVGPSLHQLLIDLNSYFSFDSTLKSQLIQIIFTVETKLITIRKKPPMRLPPISIVNIINQRIQKPGEFDVK